MTRFANNSEWKAALERDHILGPNTECPSYPCHFEGQDCTWCFCPFYPCGFKVLGGRYVRRTRGEGIVWSCKDCEWVHRSEVAEALLSSLKSLPSLDRDSLLKVMEKLLFEYPP